MSRPQPASKPAATVGPQIGNPLSRDLFAAWLFNEHAGWSRVVNRAHPGAWTTLYNSPARVVTEFGPARSFRHTSSQYASASETVPKGPLTIVARIRRPVSSAYAFFCTQRLTNGSQSAFQFWLNGATGDKKLYFLNGTHSSVASNSALTSATAWYQIAVAYDDISRVRFYINGKLDVTRTLTTSATWPRTNLQLQRDTASSSNYASADIEHVYIFRRELTGVEIGRLYADPHSVLASRPHTAGLIFQATVHDLEGSIAATATLTGDAMAVRGLAGQIAGSSNLSGSLNLSAALAGGIVAASALAGDLRAIRGLAGSIVGTSLLTGDLTIASGGTIWDLAGAIAAQADLAGDLRVTRELAGQIAASAALVADLAVDRALEGAIAASSMLTGAINLRQALAGSIVGASSLTGTLALTHALAGAITAQAELLGDLQIEGAALELEGAITAHANLSGSLSVVRALAGSVEAHAGVAGSLAVVRALAGAIEAQATLLGELEILAGQVQLEGSITAAGTLTGDLTVNRALEGAIGAASEVLGGLTLLAGLSGSIVGRATLVGQLRLLSEMIGDVIDPDLVSLTPWYGLNSAAVVLDFVESGPDFLPLSLTPTYDLLSLTEKANVT